MEDYKKKYEDALNAARKFKNDCPSLWDTESNPFRNVFEELKESEDEKISKALIHLINEQDGFLTAINGISVKDVIAWLEKQGEQKPTEDNCRISDCVEKVDMTEYNNGYECGKQRVLKYPEDYGLCKKYVWSEEDEVFLKDCISTIYSANTSKSKAVLVHWLKSFKERMKGE